MLLFVKCCTLVTAYSGLYHLGLILLRIPSRRSERSFKLAVVQQKRLWDQVLESLVEPFVEPIAQFIPLGYENAMELQAGLRQVGITLSAAEYYAKGLLLAFYSLAVVFFVPLLGLPPSYLLLAGLIPPIVFRHFTTEHSDRLEAKRQGIRLLLPSFVRTILYSLADKEEAIKDEIVGRANLIAIFSNYLEACPEMIKYDLSLLITEMQSLSVETGIRRFGERLNIPTVTYLCDILIGISKGQSHAEALRILAIDIDIQGREALRLQLQKRPGEMRRATVVLVVLGMAIVIYVLIADLINSWGFFG
ncbi:MAG: hypothetical protein FWF06_00975 [Symbiobacteriaceae bacterium]|nr:hypothetical protein [Symbiobacteriaceae bacterium]